MLLILVLALSYMVGSIPTAVWVGKITRGVDVRKYGSGNAGATNALRVLGLRAGLAVLAVDMCKGLIAVLCFANIISASSISVFHPDLVRVLAGSLAIVGHIFPITTGFRGGKGVGTAAGVMLALAPMVTLCVLVLWIVIVALTRYVSLASMAAALSMPLLLVLVSPLTKREPGQALIFFSVVLALAVMISHHANIKRLLSGRENKFTMKRSQSPGGPP